MFDMCVHLRPGDVGKQALRSTGVLWTSFVFVCTQTVSYPCFEKASCQRWSAASPSGWIACGFLRRLHRTNDFVCRVMLHRLASERPDIQAFMFTARLFRENKHAWTPQLWRSHLNPTPAFERVAQAFRVFFTVCVLLSIVSGPCVLVVGTCAKLLH